MPSDLSFLLLARDPLGSLGVMLLGKESFAQGSWVPREGSGPVPGSLASIWGDQLRGAFWPAMPLYPGSAGTCDSLLYLPQLCGQEPKLLCTSPAFLASECSFAAQSLRPSQVLPPVVSGLHSFIFSLLQLTWEPDTAGIPYS